MSSKILLKPGTNCNVVAALVVILTLLVLVPMPSAATERILFRIGTGGDSGTYYPIGSLIAKALSNSSVAGTVSGTVSGGSGVNNRLLPFVQRSTGSQANLADISSGLLEAGLAQADVVHWAYNAAGPFSGALPQTNLRTVATLYSENVHLVVHRDSGISRISDLVGRLVSVDELGSGTRLNIPYILNAYGVDAGQLKTVFLKPIDAMDRLRKKQLDAFFIVSGYPVNGLAALVEEGVASVLPIAGPNVQSLLQQYPFFTVDSIPANTYADTAAVTTLAVPAQLMVDASLDDELVYQITEELWHPRTARLLAAGHPKGKDVRFDSAVNGLIAPLHPGAERYYRGKSHVFFTE